MRYLQSKQFPNITWAISGRNESKLKALKDDMNVAADVPIMIADTSDQDSLQTAFAQAKIVLNCTGHNEEPRRSRLHTRLICNIY